MSPFQGSSLSTTAVSRQKRNAAFVIVAAAVLFTVASISGQASPDVIRIGVVYDQDNSPEEYKWLSQALERGKLNVSDARHVASENVANGDPRGTGDSDGASRLSLATVTLNPDDILRSAKKLCRFLEQGLLAVLGPQQPETAWLVRTACFRHRMAHFYSHRDDDAQWRVAPDSVSVTLSPSPVELSQALKDLVEAQQWAHFTIIYERPEALVRLRGLLNLQSPVGGQPVPVSLRMLTDKEDPRPLLREIAKSADSNVVLDLAAERLAEVLKAAQKIGIITEYHSYVVTTLDMHTLDLTPFQNSGTNLTGFELLNRELWEQDIGAVRQAYAKKGVYPIFLGQRPSRNSVRTEVALVQDALNILVRGVGSLAKTGKLGRPPAVRCRGNHSYEVWEQSRRLVDAVKKTPFSGLTGPVWLDHMGRRHNVSLHVVKLKRGGLASVGKWSASSGLHMTRMEKTFQEEVLSTLRNKTLRITSIVNAPYVMLKASAHKLSANDRFEGFCVDLLREISQHLGFRYRIRLVRDGAHGTRDAQGRWNGMVRELIDKEADLAIGDLTITSAREEAVDFTLPFMTLGVSILFSKRQEEHSLFFFLSPLSVDVWLCVAAAHVVISLLLVCVTRVESARSRSSRTAETRYYCNCQESTTHCGQDCVGEKLCGRSQLDIIKVKSNGAGLVIDHGEKICGGAESVDTVDIVKNQLTLLNSLWFTISSIMQQGCEPLPRSASTCIIAATWWLFSFVLVSSYTANLASFLTRERLRSPIESVEDLAKQSEIRYGCVRSGSTQTFFQESRHETYERMWHAMRDDVVSSNAQGVARVESGGYAFLMESASIEYVVQRRCRLTQIGGLLDSKGYGIALPQGSPYRSFFSSAILRLQENGTLHMLKERWWKVRDPNRHCPEEDGPSRPGSASELGLPKVGGVFVVLLAGLGLACLIAFVEFFMKVRSARR
ncbi:glutamate receptor ionotropic, kainate 2-like isoform X2 [Dermacentor silvarum]|uniref:glutamate receptor ionotropic, kainate 2-like isoform X2 n=1 Tax=Dermacentor silvarum TaxID=543639 RepID=UPI00189863CC|nr:glutamate receptor ionotropic, kainate 2-like isoform X2 [Dermacentor silvarum]